AEELLADDDIIVAHPVLDITAGEDAPDEPAPIDAPSADDEDALDAAAAQDASDPPAEAAELDPKAPEPEPLSDPLSKDVPLVPAWMLDDAEVAKPDDWVAPIEQAEKKSAKPDAPIAAADDDDDEGISKG